MDRTLGPYRLGDSLGMLPFGELIAATHPSRSESLAVLVLDERLAKEPRFRGLLRLENARVGGLRHPALARTIEIGEAAGNLFLVVERPPESRTLASAMSEGAPASIETSGRLVQQLAAGLDAAHARRLVHGAIEPACIMVGNSGAAMLVGVGVLGAVEEAGLIDVVWERRDQDFGAPEQRQGPRAVASADGFALATLAASLARQARPDGLPAQAEDVLARQRKADVTARYPTCTALATALTEGLMPAPGSDALAPPIVAAQGRAQPRGAPPDTAPPTRALATSPGAPTRSPSPSGSAPAPTPILPAKVATPVLSTEVATPAVPAEAPEPPSQVGLPTVTVAPPTANPLPRRSPSRAPSPTTAPTHPTSLSDLGDRIRRLIDPPASVPVRSAPPARPGVMPVPRSDPRSVAPGSTAVAMTTLVPTRAMLECLDRLDVRDPLGDALRWAARLSPSVDSLLSRVCVDGKLGPVPLGIAAAGVLALLFLVVDSIVIATAIIMLVVVLYAVPWVIKALTAAERRTPQVVRCSRQVRLRRRSFGLGLEQCQIDLGNDVTLAITSDGYARLAALGQPVTVERPVLGTTGVRLVVLEHQIPNVAVTYVQLRNILLDVRDAGGAVLLRNAGYEGEPGDVLADGAMGPKPAAGAAPRTRRSGRGEAVVGPMPADLRAALLKAHRTAMQKAVLVAGLPAGVLILTLGTSFAGFAVVVLIGVLFTFGARAVEQAVRLQRASTAPDLVRVTGPVILSHHASDRSAHYRMRLEDDAVLTIDGPTHARLAHAAQLRMGQDRGAFWDEWTRSEYLRSEHELASATVAYEPLTPLLLEIVNPFGQTLYRDPALGTTQIRSAGPRI